MLPYIAKGIWLVSLVKDLEMGLSFVIQVDPMDSQGIEGKRGRNEGQRQKRSMTKQRLKLCKVTSQGMRASWRKA